jgi:hypothetical protein
MRSIHSLASQRLRSALVAFAVAALPAASCSSSTSVAKRGDGGPEDGKPETGSHVEDGGDDAPVGADAAPSSDSAVDVLDAAITPRLDVVSDRASAIDAAPSSDSAVDVLDAAILDLASDGAVRDTSTVPDTLVDASRDDAATDVPPSIDASRDRNGEVKSVLACQEIYVCSQGCGSPAAPAGDSACVDACIALGCASAQSAFNDLWKGCRQSLCLYTCGAGSSSPSCLDCVSSNCPVPLQKCVETGC